MKTDTVDLETKALWEGVAATFSFLSDVSNNVLTEQSVDELRSALGATEGDDVGYGKMQRYFAEKASCSTESLLTELSVDWTLLFRGVNQKGGPRPPYAGVWLSTDGVGIEVMCEIGQYYVNSQLGASAQSANRLDYLGVELEFVSRLADRIAQGSVADVAVLAEFLDRYLGSWVESYVSEVQEKGKTDFWKGFLELLTGSLRELREWVAVQQSAEAVS